ncbi:hypothetical protein cyc_07061 [Cyclospora cayetanensis]|uniref:FAS1 domain-containing protein n=1 Tax=Cyclospora cayetanensis TaxID=88456 RepID=A0A1D3CZM7_9EIME|nr:hypothetical protein cyc_07061 [Cyclospora cayetanensis]
MKSLLVIAAALVTCGPALCSAKSIMDYLRTDDRLYEARLIAEDAGIINDIDPSRFGTQLTLILPSNEAFDQLNVDHPKWRQALVSNKNNVETPSNFKTYKALIDHATANESWCVMEAAQCVQLILFAASDMLVTPSSIRSGKWAAEGSIVSLLSETANIATDGYVCVSDYTRTASCEDPNSLPCCAMIDMDNVIKADDGYIYIIDAVMMPQEIVDKMP